MAKTRGPSTLRVRSCWACARNVGRQLTATYSDRRRPTATDGAKSTGTAVPVNFQARRESYLSPKVGVGWQLQGDWALKISTGHAVRLPTAGGWFQGHAQVDIVTNPKLKPEKGWTTEVTSEHALPALQRLRSTLFHENTLLALHSQAIAGTSPVVNSVQNIDRICTWGVDAAYTTRQTGSPKAWTCRPA